MLLPWASCWLVWFNRWQKPELLRLHRPSRESASSSSYPAINLRMKLNTHTDCPDQRAENIAEGTLNHPDEGQEIQNFISFCSKQTGNPWILVNCLQDISLTTKVVPRFCLYVVPRKLHTVEKTEVQIYYPTTARCQYQEIRYLLQNVLFVCYFIWHAAGYLQL